MAETFWKTLQEEQAPWSHRNFASSRGKTHHPVLGVIEELGELAEAYEKKDRDGIVDASADAMIFLSDVCNRKSWSLQALVDAASMEVDCEVEDKRGLFLRVMKDVGKIAHHQLKEEQGIRTNENHDDKLRGLFARIVGLVWDVYDESRVDSSASFSMAVREVWDRVKKRNWVADPVAGGAS